MALGGITSYSDPGVAPRENTYAYGSRRKRMPYKTKAQARAVMANTDESNPRHREARSHAKAALKKRKPNGMMIKRGM